MHPTRGPHPRLAEPRRGPARDRFAVVLSAMVIVAMALLVGWQYAAHRARLASRPSVPAAPVAPVARDGLSLATPLLSVRRAPSALAAAASSAEVRASLASTTTQLGEGSCLTVSVDGRAVVEVNPTTPVLPGDALQLVTAAVAIDVLGADSVFTTRVTGTVADEAEVGQPGVVLGDLYLVGGGDPLLSTAWCPTSGVQALPPFGTTPLEALADEVVARGVLRVAGSVVGDGSRYDDEWFPPSWHLSVVRTEGGPVDALLVNDGHIDRSAPGEVVDDPAVGAAAVFTELLRERGVQVDGAPRSGPAISADELAATVSYPLRAVVLEMLHTRDNNTAELLLKEIGLQERGIGSREEGLTVVRSRLASWGVPTDGVTLVDGSGLSNDDRITCAALAAVLGHGRPDDVIGDAMPVAGASGGFAAELPAVPPGWRLAAVIGSRANAGLVGAGGGAPGVQSLAGYLRPDGAVGDGTDEDASARSYDVVVILNGAGVSDPAMYRPIWDALVPALASVGEGAPVDELEPR